MKKIVYVNPPYGDDFVRSARWAAKSRGRVQRHPEQALILIAMLERDGHKCKFIEGAARNMTREEVISEVIKFAPDIAVIHTTTPSIYNDINYAFDIKKSYPNCINVLVGAHVSAEPENTFDIAGCSVDVIARGEPEKALCEISEDKKFSEVQGISYRCESDIVNNSSASPIDVNTLPFPAWKHIDPHWYHDAGKLYPFLTLYSARGCHGACTFCRERHVINGSNVRVRSAKAVVDEIEYDIALFPYLKEIMFETDTFTANPKHVIDVCNEIITRGLHKKIKWSCNIRVDVQLNLLPLMKKAGCRMLMVGFEFGTNDQLNAVAKGTTIEMADKFAYNAHKLGFVIHGCFMIGAPGETEQSAQATIDFAKSLPLDTIQISGIAVYPGTPLYRWAKEKKYLTVTNWEDWVNDKKEQVTLLSYPQMSKSKIDFYIDKGLREFYLRPVQIIKMLFTVRSFHDIIRKFYGLKSFLNYFFVKKLRVKR